MTKQCQGGCDSPAVLLSSQQWMGSCYYIGESYGKCPHISELFYIEIYLDFRFSLLLNISYKRLSYLIKIKFLMKADRVNFRFF